MAEQTADLPPEKGATKPTSASKAPSNEELIQEAVTKATEGFTAQIAKLTADHDTYSTSQDAQIAELSTALKDYRLKDAENKLDPTIFPSYREVEDGKEALKKHEQEFVAREQDLAKRDSALEERERTSVAYELARATNQKPSFTVCPEATRACSPSNCKLLVVLFP